MSEQGRPARLLPWERDDGNPCYLRSDGGLLHQLADAKERRERQETDAARVQQATRALHGASTMLEDPHSTCSDIRDLALQLAASLGEMILLATPYTQQASGPEESDQINGRPLSQEEH